MNLKQLKYFIAVADEGSISAAARKLYMSQPPLSAQLKLLEEELGCALFERGARKITLTDAGRVLYRRASVMLDMERITAEEVRLCAERDKGTVRIGIVSSVVCSIAVPQIKRFSKIHGNVRFEITEANTYELIEKLKAGIISMAIIRTPFLSEGLEQVVLADDSIIAVGRKDCMPDADTISLEQLANKKIIMYRRWEPILRKQFSEKGLSPDCICINDDARTSLSLAESGLGIAIVPSSAAGECPDCLTRAKIEDCGIDSQIRLVYSSTAHISECAGKFIDFFTDKV